MTFVHLRGSVSPKLPRLSLIVLAAATIATPALAQAAIRVGYSDLNLQTRAGSEVMLARLKSAARRVCGSAPAIQALERYQAYSECVRHPLGDPRPAVERREPVDAVELVDPHGGA